MNRRDFFKIAGAVAAAAAVGQVEVAQEISTSIEVIGTPTFRHNMPNTDENTIFIDLDKLYAEAGYIDHTHLKEHIIINRVYTDNQGHTAFDITRNI
jgi:hypothetical protein